MALPDSHMSVVLSIGADLFRRRTEDAIKTRAEVNCFDPANSLLNHFVVFTHPDPEETAFLKDESGALFAVIGLKVNFSFGRYDAYLKLAIGGALNPDDPQAFDLVLAYDEMLGEVFELIPAAERTQFNLQIALMLNPILADLPLTIPLGALLAQNAALTAAPLLRIPGVAMSSADRVRDRTLVIGLQVDTDSGLDPDFFLEDFTADPRQEADWHVSVDSGLLRARVNEFMSSEAFGESLEDNIDDWKSTESAEAFWSGDDVSGQLFKVWQEEYVDQNAGLHPIWFKVTGFYDIHIEPGLAIRAYALGYADLGVGLDGDGVPSLLVTPTIFAVGYGILEFPPPDEAIAPQVVASAYVADRLRATAVTFSRDHLAVAGIDEHPGLAGNGVLQVPEALSVTLSAAGPGACHRMGGGAGGMILLAEGIIQGGIIIQNTGEAPLWICQTLLEDPDDVFELYQVPQVPFSIPAGSYLSLRVRYHIPEGDENVHTASLTLRSNDYTQVWATVAITGQYVGVPAPTHDASELCFGRPEEIPPQEWFDRVSALIGGLHDLVIGTLTPDDMIEVAFDGLPSDVPVRALDGHDGIVAEGRPYGTTHYLSIPFQTARRLDLDAASLPRDAALDVQLTTSRLSRVGRFDDSRPPADVALEGGFAYARFADRVAVIDVREPGRPVEVGRIDVAGAGWIDVAGTHILVQSGRGVRLYETRDPGAPVPRHTFDLPAGGSARMMGRHVGLLGPDALRIYALDGRGAPALRHTLKLDPGAAIVPSRGGWAVGTAQGGVLVDLGGAAGGGVRPVGKAEMAAIQREGRAGEAWRAASQPLQARPDKARGGFELLARRYGDLKLDGAKIARRLLG